MTGMTCLYVFFEGLFMRKIVVTKLTNVPIEMKVIVIQSAVSNLNFKLLSYKIPQM